MLDICWIFIGCSGVEMNVINLEFRQAASNQMSLPWEIVVRGHSEGFCDIDSADGNTVVSNVGIGHANQIIRKVNCGSEKKSAFGDAVSLDGSFLRYLRMNGFALTYFGGNVLRKNESESIEAQTWDKALDKVCNGVAETGHGTDAQVRLLKSTIKEFLVDLNGIENKEAAEAVAKEINQGLKR